MVDSNIIVYFYLKGTQTSSAELVFDKDSQWCVPLLWRSEFRSAATQYIKEGTLTLENAIRSFDQAQDLLDKSEYQIQTKTVLELAVKSKLSSYDCEYVSLAKQLNIPLVTTDSDVLKAFPGIAVHPKDFIRLR